MSKAARHAAVRRETAETRIFLKLDIDGAGRSRVATGVPFFDHMLTLLAKHALFDLEVKAEGDLEVDQHHTVEDTGIALGTALKEALGNKAGIRRYGHAYVPMDETLSRAVVDLSGRVFFEYRVKNTRGLRCGDFPVTLVEEFFRALANQAQMNLHIENLYGRDAHHLAESIFKSVARALEEACRRDPRVKGTPSTKGVL
ncbi:MAG: imidazoleglycerol-phosphate dehydratase HisB [Bdellovibrionaceae bacterium]|nr:imidazoleglycerol-phosphate dehydratase HisB [Pseudobdellovibrionaceae bacterium]